MMGSKQRAAILAGHARRKETLLAERAELVRLRAEHARLKSMVEAFVACMFPHPVEHPSMHRAWTRGKALLAELRPETAKP